MAERIDAKKLRDALTSEQIKKVLEDLGSNPIETSHGFALETICHNLPGHSHGKKLYYYENSKLFRCYTECQESFDIFELVIKTVSLRESGEPLTLPIAIQKVLSILGLNEGDYSEEYEASPQSSIQEEIDLIQFYLSLENRKSFVPPAIKERDSKVLSNLAFVPPLPWMQEGISIDTMIRYGIKYYGTQHKIVIPHYSHSGALIGVRFRALVEEDVNRFGKYGPIFMSGVMYNHPLGQNLYGFNKNLENIRKMKKIIIFESEKSVLLYDTLFGEENNISVAVCGSSISLIQLELIKLYSPEVEEIIIAFDRQFKERGDKEFFKHTSSLTSIAKKISKQYSVSIIFDKEGVLDYKDSPIDKGKEIFINLFEKRLSQNGR